MNIIRQFCETYAFPEDTAAALAEAYGKLQAHPEGYALFLSQRECCRDDLIFDHVPVFQALHSLEEMTGIPAFTVDMLYLIILMPLLKARYEAEGIPQRYFDGFAENLRHTEKACFTVYGIHGVSTGWWLIDYFKLKLFTIGRLQFRRRRFRISGTGTGFQFREGDYYVDVHIPPGDALTREKCLAAYREAACFFCKRFGMKTIIFGCFSWMLSPALGEMLPAGSNILAFAGDYILLEIRKDPSSSAVSFIFNVPDLPADVDLLPEKTGLQRAVKRHLKAGKTIDPAFGLMPYPLE